MLRSSIFLFLICSLLAVSCNDTDCCLPANNIEDLTGNWQVYERGYSPGAGYIIEVVPDEPVQVMTFESDNRFLSNYDGLQDYLNYHVLRDEDGRSILALYKNKSDLNTKQDVNNLEHSYIIEFEQESLKLYFRYCIEGCHIGLRKL